MNDTPTAPTENLPAALEAEAAVLGAALLDPSALDTMLASLRGDDFYRNAHQRVFEACKRLVAAGQTVDLVTVQAHLSAAGQLDAIGGPVALAGLTEATASTYNVDAYVKLVRDRAQTRRLMAVSALIRQEALENIEEPARAADRAVSLILDTADNQLGHRPEGVAEVMRRTIEQIEQAKKRTGLEMSTGFRALDALLLGLHPGHMTVVAARPGMGKTALCMNMASELAVVQGIPGVIFSMEMRNEDLMTRMLASMASVDFAALRSGRLDSSETGRLINAATHLSKARLFITNPGTLDLDGIRASIRRLQRQEGIRWVMVDYLGLVPSGLKKVDTRAQEIGYISRTLKKTFLDTGVVGIVAAQLNRESVRTTGSATQARRPRLSDLRDSGEIEQDADDVLMIWRPDADDASATSGMPDDGDLESEVIVAKQRQGRTGVVPLVWQGRYVRFQNPRWAAGEAAA